jgi:hypothetical protein
VTTLPLLGDEPDLTPIHTRDYQVRAYRLDAERFVLRGAVRDTKPAGLYIEDDPEPLGIHHMIVQLTIHFPDLMIEDASVVFETHPHASCPRIVDHYRNLVGLSIARGFTHRVRELFGGPRGCTHTTALLQAMAPVAVQSIWSMNMAAGRIAGADDADTPVALSRLSAEEIAEMRRAAMARNVNSCHVWDEHGEQVASIVAGDEMEPPLWIVDRYRELGRDASTWRERSGAS